MKTLFTFFTAVVLFALTANSQNINWSTDYQGGECSLAMPEWDGFIGNSTYDAGFIHTVNLNDGEEGYNGTVTPYQTKVVRVLMAPGVDMIMVSGTWSHTYSGVTLHGFFPGELNQEGDFTENFEPGLVCTNSCTAPFIDPVTELYLYSSFLDDQKQISRTELGIPIDQPIWVSYVMYQDHDSYSNSNVSLTFNCNVIGEENVTVYREWLAERTWYTTPGTGSYDGIYEYWNTTSITNVSENEFTVYPNPTTNNVQLTMNNVQLSRDIQILDITGKIIINIIASEVKQSIDISNLQNGVYFIKIGTQVQKFIKK